MKIIGLVLGVLVSCGTTPYDDDDDVVVAHSGPVITSVQTDDGFTQVRQSAVAIVVIRGAKLGQTTSVLIGDTPAELDHVAPHEVRVAFGTATAAPPGPLDVTLTTTHSTVVAHDALTITPFIVSPTATTGHGTYQSPMSLCDPDLVFAGLGSLARLLAGTHRCGQVPPSTAPASTVRPSRGRRSWRRTTALRTATRESSSDSHLSATAVQYRVTPCPPPRPSRSSWARACPACSRPACCPTRSPRS